METFFKTHKYLVEHVNSPVKRGLMQEIDWSHRLIGIKGSRGVGKTTFWVSVCGMTWQAGEEAVCAA